MEQEGLRWQEPLAAELALFNHLDGYAGLRNGLRAIARDRGDWTGIPLPLTGERLVIEPTYPKAKELSEICSPPMEPETATGQTIRNTFWSWTKRSTITIWSEADGRIEWGVTPGAQHLGMDLQTLGCCDAWGIEQERNALQTFGSLVRHRQFKQWMLTGMFMERSRRSNISYLFRRLKPTLAISSAGDHLRVLAALCLHPIAYYAQSWAGAMCPTDDMLAHLMMMRGDEHMFWRRANQHAAYRPEAGI